MDIAVFVRHWQVAAYAAGGNIVRRGLPPNFVEQLHGYPGNNHLLTISLVSRLPQDPVRTFDFDMQGASTPLFITSLAHHGLLSIYFAPNRNTVQFVFHIPDKPLPSARSKCLSRVLKWLCNFHNGAPVAPDVNLGKKWVFDVIRRLQKDHDADEYMPYLKQVAANQDLNVTLRPYQIRAVAWMMSRELGPRLHLFRDVVWEDAKLLASECVIGHYPHVQVQSNVAINSLEGQVKVNDTSLDEVDNVKGNRGGLLCDEMGLGKTVELMQLVLCNKLREGSSGTRHSGQPSRICQECRQQVPPNSRRFFTCLECEQVRHKACMGGHEYAADKYGFVCPECTEWMQYLSKEDTPPADLPMSKATVVIIPTTLLLQWQTEIQKHCKDALKIEIFLGLRKSGYIPQKRLMEADVVLTTYDALQADVAIFTAIRKPRTGLRNPPKFRPTPIPLLTLRWHRLALDESQMLGFGGVNQSAEMASYLHATYRWCVTGTPLPYSVGNLVPMLDMLRIQGGESQMNWPSFFNRTNFAEHESIVRYALRQLMWRSSKADITGEELTIPPQTIEEVRTRFGPVEKFHYNSLQQSVHQATMRCNRDDRRAVIVSHELVTMLRQACCHPQIGNSGRRLASRVARQALRKTMPRVTNENALKNASTRAENPLDMNEVLDALITKAKVECEESLRNFVASSNGLAAVCWLQHSTLPQRSSRVDGLVAAVCLYRETLSLCNENKGVVRLDHIQKMHILFNLNEALLSVTSTQKRISVLNLAKAEKAAALRELSSIGVTIRDAGLSREVESLRKGYLAEAQALLAAATASYNEIASELGRKPLYVNENTTNSAEDEAELTENGADRAEDRAGREEDEADKASDEADKVGDDAGRPRACADYDHDADGSGCYESGKQLPLPHNSTTRRKRRRRPWWVVAVAAVLEKDERRQESFLNRIIRKLADQSPGAQVNFGCLANRVSNVLVLPGLIESELAKLQKSRDKLKGALRKLPGSVPPTQAQVVESGQCRECREFGRGLACTHCRSEGLFVDVERRLYCLMETEETIGRIVEEEERLDEESETEDLPSNPQSVVNGVFRPKGSALRPPSQISGIRFESEVSIILKCLATPLRAKQDPVYTKEIADWFSRFEDLKKEHTEARKLFEAQRSLLARMDEVNMAVMRLSVVEDDEDYESLTVEEKRHRLPKGSLGTLNVTFSNEKALAEMEFSSKRGSLVYLLSLQRTSKAQDARGATAGNGEIMREGKNSQQCPICLTDFDDTVSRVAVMSCGHVFCCDCMLSLIRRSNARARISNVSCPTCRVRCPVEEISFTINRPRVNGRAGMEVVRKEEEKVSMNMTDEDEIRPQPARKRKRAATTDSIRKMRRVSDRPSTFYESEAEVRGLIGAKPFAVVRTLRGIWKQDSEAKVLIFSEWAEVLCLLSRALEMNNIVHLNAAIGSSAIQFANVVANFKTSKSINVMLLPLRRAGAGLNLTEAQHVILMEPSMNVTLEAQAIGRVHRIGQEKETFVHRILVNDTIEDKILNLGDSFRVGLQITSQSTIRLADVLGFIHSAHVVEIVDED